MQRYFVAPEQMTETMVTITGDDVKHIVRVMRMKVGDEFICANGKLRTVRCEMTYFDETCVEAKIIEELSANAELPIEVTVAQGLPKGNKLEFVVQKGTELGAHSFIPFTAHRSVVKWNEKKANRQQTRLEKIAKEAAEQSHRDCLPIVTHVHSIEQLIQTFSTFDLVLVGFEESARMGEHHTFVKALRSLESGQSLLLLIGPEGGFAEEEIKKMTEAGATLCSFGPRILRTETASLYALAAISYHFELKR